MSLNTALACNDNHFECALNQKPESVGDPKNIAKPAEKLALGMSSSYLGPKLLPTKSGYRYAGAPTGVSQITLPSPVARVDLKAPTIERLKLEATLGEQHRRSGQHDACHHRRHCGRRPVLCGRQAESNQLAYGGRHYVRLDLDAAGCGVSERSPVRHPGA